MFKAAYLLIDLSANPFANFGRYLSLGNAQTLARTTPFLTPGISRQFKVRDTSVNLYDICRPECTKFGTTLVRVELISLYHHSPIASDLPCEKPTVLFEYAPS